MSFIAGPCDITYNALSLGVIEDAYEEEWTPLDEIIVGDNYGRGTIQDFVSEGRALFLNMVLNEFNAAGASLAFHPWDAVVGNLGIVGLTAASNYAKALVATRIAATNQTFATRTYTKACLAPNFKPKWLIGARHKKVPLRLLVFPVIDQSDANKVKFHKDT